MAHSQVPGLLRRVARRVLPRMCLYAEPAQRRLSQSSATTDVSAATATIQNLVGRGKLRHPPQCARRDRKSTRLNSSHTVISYAVFCLKKKKKKRHTRNRARQLSQT